MKQWRICQRRGRTVASAREPKQESRGGAPSGVQEQSPWWGQAPGGGSGGEAATPALKLKAFVHFHTKKWPKVKDFNENLPRVWGRLLRAATTSPKFWSMGGGRLAAHSWFRHWNEMTDTYGANWPGNRRDMFCVQFQPGQLKMKNYTIY